jgi:hypothetical protein
VGAPAAAAAAGLKLHPQAFPSRREASKESLATAAGAAAAPPPPPPLLPGDATLPQASPRAGGEISTSRSAAVMLLASESSRGSGSDASEASAPP